MDRTEIETRVKTRIAVSLMFKEEQISNKDTLVGDLGCDQLDMVEIAMALEEEFSIEISDEKCESFTTVQDIIDFICDTKA